MKLAADYHAEYWQEAFELALDAEGLWHLVEQMTPEQRANIGGALCTSAECQSMAFYTPESPLVDENRRLVAKLKWQRELETCGDCNGRGRLIYRTGPWHINSHCSRCNGDGKVHPQREREPS